MSNDSLMPPAKHNNAKYAVWGLLLLLGAAIALYFAIGRRGNEPTPTPPAARPERSTALSEEEDLTIPEKEPEKEVTAPKKRPITINQGWDCTGEIDPVRASQIMKENHRIVRVCYERRLKVDNTLQGTTQLTMRVGSNGRVSGVKIAGTPKDVIFRECVKNAANRWVFPKPQGGSCALLEQPFSLAPRPE